MNETANHTPGQLIRTGHHIYGPKHAESKHRNGRILVAEVIRGTHRAVPELEGGADRFGFDSEADAQRIVDCWNACDGLSDPSVIPDLIDALTAVCSELRMLLVDTGRVPEGTDKSIDELSTPLSMARAALAKAKGASEATA